MEKYFFLNEKSKINEISKSFCKIKKDENNYSTGFFLRVKRDEKPIYMLVTAHHEIPYTLIEEKCLKIEIITIENIKQEIILNNDERKILCFFYQDITAIEILDKDIIRHKVKFLKYDKNCKYDFYKNYLNIEAFIFHHPNGEKLQYNNGKILAVGTPKKYEFEHNIYTQKGSSGSPIIYYKQSKKRQCLRPRVIGVHTSCDPNRKVNIGTFINILIEEIKKGIDNIYYQKEIPLHENRIMKIHKGTHLYAEKIYLSKNAIVVYNGGTCINIGEIIKNNYLKTKLIIIIKNKIFYIIN